MNRAINLGSSPQDFSNFELSGVNQKLDHFLSNQSQRSSIATASTSGKSTPLQRSIDSLSNNNNNTMGRSNGSDLARSNQRIESSQPRYVPPVDSSRLTGRYLPDSLRAGAKEFVPDSQSQLYHERIESYPRPVDTNTRDLNYLKNAFSDLSVNNPYPSRESNIQGIGFADNDKSSPRDSGSRRGDYISQPLSSVRAKSVIPPLNALSPEKKQFDRIDNNNSNEIVNDYFRPSNPYLNSTNSLSSPNKSMNPFHAAGISSVSGPNLLPSLSSDSPTGRFSTKRNVSYELSY
jgi:hypothetical protein